jgi:hypothetical protein
MGEEKYNVVPFIDDRYAIVDDTGVIIDDAQGYGYKNKPGAYRAMAYKFQGGKEKKALQKKKFKDWKKENPVHVEIIGRYYAMVEINAKPLARREFKLSDIWAELEHNHNVQIPDYVKKELK